jgi:uncharacterized protein YggT (Ycf19 family)
MLGRAVYSGITLYMVVVLIRWLGPWVEIDLDSTRLRPITYLTDPPIRAMRRILPDMGPMNWAPIAVLVAAWIIRIVLVTY